MRKVLNITSRQVRTDSLEPSGEKGRSSKRGAAGLPSFFLDDVLLLLLSMLSFKAFGE